MDLSKVSSPPLPSPPFVKGVEGMQNVRDIGGYPVAGQPGKVIRRGLVFRSADPGKLTDNGVKALQELGITHVYDLRSALEIEKARAVEGWDKPKEWAGATRVFAPVFLDEDYSPEALAVRFKHYTEGTEGFVRAYSSILASASHPDNTFRPFSRILAHVASPTSPTPLLVHCKGGKDRTGVICALLLSVCGVSDDIVAHEYSLTELGLYGRRQELIQHILLQNGSLRGNQEAALNMLSARKESMIASLGEIRKTYGSVERYIIDQCRLSPDDLEQIRKNLIVDCNTDGGQVQVDWETHAAMVAASNS
ncbi:hypothetical protein GQ53DRAFT_752274 [Thozetella sp. PMI_491]|nr:hypothetical protein GQ53DRAFT_752274 [Thozetella sp. PMI_491]